MQPHESALVGVAHDGCAEDGLLRPVVDGPMRADQLVFNEAGHEHRSGAFGFDAVDVAQERLAPRRLHGAIEMGAYPVAHVVGHADGWASPFGSETGRRRVRWAAPQNRWRGRAAAARIHAPRAGACLQRRQRRVQGHHAVEQFQCGRAVAHRPVPGVVADAKVFANAAEAIAGVAEGACEPCEPCTAWDCARRAPWSRSGHG